jgi:hypothetical protein
MPSKKLRSGSGVVSICVTTIDVNAPTSIFAEAIAMFRFSVFVAATTILVFSEVVVTLVATAILSERRRRRRFVWTDTEVICTSVIARSSALATPDTYALRLLASKANVLIRRVAVNAMVTAESGSNVNTGPGDGVGEGMGLGDGVGEGMGLGDGVGEGMGLGGGVGEGMGLGGGVGEGMGLGGGVGEGMGLGDGVGEGMGLGDGVGEGMGLGDGVGEGIGMQFFEGGSVDVNPEKHFVQLAEPGIEK